jgi:hypothetical protein
LRRIVSLTVVAQGYFSKLTKPENSMQGCGGGVGALSHIAGHPPERRRGGRFLGACRTFTDDHLPVCSGARQRLFQGSRMFDCVRQRTDAPSVKVQAVQVGLAASPSLLQPSGLRQAQCRYVGSCLQRRAFSQFPQTRDYRPRANDGPGLDITAWAADHLYTWNQHVQRLLDHITHRLRRDAGAQIADGVHHALPDADPEQLRVGFAAAGQTYRSGDTGLLVEYGRYRLPSVILPGAVVDTLR